MKKPTAASRIVPSLLANDLEATRP